MAKIGLDIGHGRNTFPPSKGVYKNEKGYAEHDFNSKLGLRIKELLEAQGHTVVMAQPAFSNDVPLTTRTNLYERENVDLIISIHANAGTSTVEGRCAFYWHSSTNGKRLAELVINEIKKAGYTTHGNGLHASQYNSWTNLHMTRVPTMPSILIEHGFMTNSKDFELIFGSKQAEYVEDMAQADVKAIQRYLGQDYKTTKPSTPSQPSTGVKWLGTDDKGKELIVDTDSLNYYDTQRWTNRTGSKPRGFKWKIDNLYEVDGSLQYRVQDANGNLFFTSGHSDLVKIGGTYKGSTPTTPPKSGYTGGSIVEYLNSIKVNSSFSNRQKLAQQYGISNYAGTAAQNTQLLNAMRGGSAPSTPSKSISQMATEVIRGDHGQGHAARQRSLRVTDATYQKVRAEVNRRL
jgi:N-acetylmuramoyl-L-alanine amidase